MPPAGNARALHPGWDYRPETTTRSRCSLESASGTKEGGWKGDHWKPTAKPVGKCDPTCYVGSGQRTGVGSR
ncbi:MAG: hypothetical protein LBQ54_13185 [Planctomycetaceae bacterium]|nr:hypothetical protein [Planctomycetaceae bacterium]